MRPQSLEDREATSGDWFVVRREYRHTHILTIDVEAALESPQVGTQITHGKAFHVTDFAWSPDSTRLAFSATSDPDRINGHTSDIYVVALESGQPEKIVALPESDSGPHWSPDGSQIVFSTFMGRSPSVALNRRLALVAADGGTPVSLTEDLDEHARFVHWNDDGLYLAALQKTASHLFILDPEVRIARRVTGPDDAITSSQTLTADGTRMAFTSRSPTTLAEIAVSQIESFEPRLLTEQTVQADGWKLGRRELVSWTSRDGAQIEGVVTKPADFDPNVKYPLLCVIHGGPTGIDRPSLLMTGQRNYPIDLWVARGAVILQVNYRGSAGYGEAFRRLNLRNLGVGDAWDVLSGVDHLIAQGWVDPDRMGCMGWSQGGYISAFLTTSTDRFASISVGAGISNWATYYYNTDITQFTLGYLGDDPVDDPEIYRKTSPMSYIRDARTPTLIQHGEFDRRVPIPNAYELRQGLEDRGVPVEMVVYHGFGHGINTPKAQRALMWHNLVWFNHYLWGDPLPALAEMPGSEAPAVSSSP